MSILNDDLDCVLESLTAHEIAFFSGRSILITGCGGFLGYSFMHFFHRFGEELKVKVVGVDNHFPGWLRRLHSSHILLEDFDVRKGDFWGLSAVDTVIHMATYASPAAYRSQPLATFEANILGLRSLLDFYKDRELKGFLYFSSSEIYGTPSPINIPTNENYIGSTPIIGPRACYDESKRCGETMSSLYATAYGLPIVIVRPFNNYGPGMGLFDGRVPSDFKRAVINNQDIEILSNGSPTRTFCYVADALVGYLKALTLGHFDFFNIGNNTPEISIPEFAELFRDAGKAEHGYTGSIQYVQSSDPDYLTHSPMRRCPDISKARRVLGFNPTMPLADGIRRFINFGGDL